MLLGKIEEMWVVSFSKTDSAFGLENDFFPQLGIVFQHAAEYVFCFTGCIYVGMVKHVDPDL
ncbi:hypothetical protein D3C78_1642590 [compost metagenome]